MTAAGPSACISGVTPIWQREQRDLFHAGRGQFVDRVFNARGYAPNKFRHGLRINRKATFQVIDVIVVADIDDGRSIRRRFVAMELRKITRDLLGKVDRQGIGKG